MFASTAIFVKFLVVVCMHCTSVLERQPIAQTKDFCLRSKTDRYCDEGSARGISKMPLFWENKLSKKKNYGKFVSGCTHLGVFLSFEGKVHVRSLEMPAKVSSLFHSYILKQPMIKFSLNDMYMYIYVASWTKTRIIPMLSDVLYSFFCRI